MKSSCTSALKSRDEFGREPTIARFEQEEPFKCVSCGKPFGVRATVENMVAKLSSHSMYADERALRRLRMCADCRVIDLSQAPPDPFAAGSRPLPRTTDGYFAGHARDDDDEDS